MMSTWSNELGHKGFEMGEPVLGICSGDRYEGGIGEHGAGGLGVRA